MQNPIPTMPRPSNNNLTLLLYAIAAVLAILKLTGRISLSWWGVFLPIWVPFAVGVVLLIIAFLLEKASKKKGV
jgi:hypothetical protein